MDTIAHIRATDKAIQSVEAHLLEVKNLAEHYGDKIGLKYLCGLAGLLHDVGKFNTEFKNYILAAVYHPEAPPKRGSVDHSTAGGKILYDLYDKHQDPYYGLVSDVVGNAIISHHSYLHDFLNAELESGYLKRVKDKEINEYEEIKVLFFRKVMCERDFKKYVEKARKELVTYLKIEETNEYARRLMFLSKYIFSALIDADRTNAMEFEQNQNEESIDYSHLLSKYYDRLITKLNEYSTKETANTPINKLRNEMSLQCDLFAAKPSGIYTLSIPTGGGKTLASLRYALKHAMLHNKKRIIYIVPYTTIIEQNANEVRKLLNDNGNILEHHSNVIYDDGEHAETLEQKKLKLAKDNWDLPIVFSTSVQFLNIFYSGGTRNIRRLHNLSNAIIIFDEVQKIPVHCISLFNHSLNFLKVYGNSSIVLCTATQPALDFVQHKLDIDPKAEMIENIDRVISEFKRVHIIDKATEATYTQADLMQFINDKLADVNNMLVILNTKKAVKDLYEELMNYRHEIAVYHLSTSMCPKHRMDILDRVKDHLKNNEKVICVSTQLMEAGVDISFESVIRSTAGLDSIAQAAGRCNRHGEREIGYVYIIDYENENLTRLKEIAKGKEITKIILRDIAMDHAAYGGDVLSRQSMERYFKEFFTYFDTVLDYPIQGFHETMVELLMADGPKNNYLKEYVSKFKQLPPLRIANSYRTAALNFEVIDSATTAVIVPYKEGKNIIADLNSDSEIENVSVLFQNAQQFTVNLYHNQIEDLGRSGSLVTLFDNKVYALKEGAYDQEFGVNIEGDSSLELLSF